jgi:hypothetical protein
VEPRKSSSARPAGEAAGSQPGVYGFAIALDEPDEGISSRLVTAPSGWPQMRVRRTVERAPRSAPYREVKEADVEMDADGARVLLPGGAAIMSRDSGEAWFRTDAALSTDELVHPMLGYAALAFAHWMGRDCFHAGVFLSGGQAWALLGQRGSGKSSTLAWLARNRQQIVADDLLFLDGRTAFVGPRTIDLPSASVSHLGLGQDLEHVRQGFRQRLALESLAPEHRLAGWVSLAWGDEVEIASVAAGERIALLTDHGHNPRGEANWSNVLALASLPTFELRRPRRLDSLDAAGELLLETTAAAAVAGGG